MCIRDSSDSYITYIKEDLAKLDPTNPSDTSMYIDLKSQLDTCLLYTSRCV